MPGNEWIGSLKPYEGADTRKSIRQFSLTLVSFLVLVASMVVVQTKQLPYWIALCIAVPAALFNVKIFIIMHDCGHNSFFDSQRFCAPVGRICGVMTFTPYFDWRRTHAIHHATVSNLERRGVGDVWTMTVGEYRASTWAKRIRYRIYRNPLFLFLIAPMLQFLVGFRFPLRDTRRKCLLSVLMTDLVLAIIISVFAATVGIRIYLKTFLPIMFFAASGGVWLFYIQHQFSSVYWAHSVDWDSTRAAMEGSSFYQLPGILRWFSGNIGYHHIHHLDARIPNYKLRRCYDEVPEVRRVIPITVAVSLNSLFLHLWDESSEELVKFRYLKRNASGD